MPAIARLGAHERVRVADDARAAAQRAELAAFAPRERVERQERRAAELALAQVARPPLGVFRGLGDDVREAARRTRRRARARSVRRSRSGSRRRRASRAESPRCDASTTARVPCTWPSSAASSSSIVCSRDSAPATSEAISRWRAAASATRCRGGLAAFARDARALALRAASRFVPRDQQLALARSPRARDSACVRVRVALASARRVSRSRRSISRSAPRDLRAPLGFARRALGGRAPRPRAALIDTRRARARASATASRRRARARASCSVCAASGASRSSSAAICSRSATRSRFDAVAVGDDCVRLALERRRAARSPRRDRLRCARAPRARACASARCSSSSSSSV